MILQTLTEEHVKGVIIGGDIVAAQLYYDGRPQGTQIYCRSNDEAIELASLQLGRIKNELGTSFNLIYEKPRAWEVRIFD